MNNNEKVNVVKYNHVYMNELMNDNDFFSEI